MEKSSRKCSVVVTETVLYIGHRLCEALLLADANDMFVKERLSRLCLGSVLFRKRLK